MVVLFVSHTGQVFTYSIGGFFDPKSGSMCFDLIMQSGRTEDDLYENDDDDGDNGSDGGTDEEEGPVL